MVWDTVLLFRYSFILDRNREVKRVCSRVSPARTQCVHSRGYFTLSYWFILHLSTSYQDTQWYSGRTILQTRSDFPTTQGIHSLPAEIPLAAAVPQQLLLAWLDGDVPSPEHHRGCLSSRLGPAIVLVILFRDRPGHQSIRSVRQAAQLNGGVG